MQLFLSIRRSFATLLVLSAAVSLSLSTAAPANAKEGGSPLDSARQKLRQEDLAGALKDLDKALALDAHDPDANILYQDTASAIFGVGDVRTRFDEQAEANPDDALFQYLPTRLLDPEDALKRCEQLVKQFGDSPWPLVGKARALEALGKDAAALKAHDSAIALAPEEARFRTYRAYALERLGRWSDAVAAWRQVGEAFPKDGAARIGLGEALRRSGDVDGAVTAFKEAIPLLPKDPEPHYRIGIALLDAGTYTGALAALKTALGVDPEMIESLCASAEAGLADVKAKAEEARKPVDPKDLEAALAFAKSAAEKNDDSARAHFVLGAVFETLGEVDPDQLQSAIDEYSATLAIYVFPGPERVRALVARSYANLQAGRFEEALADAEKALDIDEDHDVATLHAGHALAGQDDHAGAVKKYFAPGLKKWKGDHRFHYALGMSYWSLAKSKDARKHLEAAVKAEPKDGLYRLSLGEFYYAEKKTKDAVTEFFEATELRPWDVAAWRGYGRACTSEKHWDDAVEAFEKVVELDKEAIDEYLYLAIILNDQLDRKDDAKKHIQTFLDKGGEDSNLESWIERLLSDD